MNYNKYIINKRKKTSYFLLIVPLIIVAIIYFIINTMPFRIFKPFKNLSTTSMNNSTIVKENTTNVTGLKEDENEIATNSSVSNYISYFLVGYYENEVNTSSEKIIESMTSIKINYDGNVFFLTEIMVDDEFDNDKILIEENKFSIIQFDLLNSKTNDKLMNSIFLSVKGIFGKLTEVNIEAIKTEDFKDWVSALPREREDEENYDKLVSVRNQIADLNERMILEDCIGIIQTIIN